MRDDFLVILDLQTHVLRAGVGVGEVIPLPSVDVPARVALRLPRDPATSSSSVPSKVSDYLVGQALNEAERSGEELEIIWPMLGRASEQDRSTSNASVGSGKKPENDIDWVGLAALFRHVVVTGLGLSTRPANYMFLLAYPATLPLSAQECLTQIFFETLGVSNFLLIERPLAQLYSCAAMTGVVVDVGERSTEVSVILETQTHYPSLSVCEVGEKDCDDYLVQVLLEANPELPSQLGQPPLEAEALHAAVLRIVDILKQGEFIKYSSTEGGTVRMGGVAEEEEEEGITDVAKALASGRVAKLLANGANDAGVQTLEDDQLLIPNPVSSSLPAITMGPERHRYAEPLFNPDVLQRGEAKTSLPEVVANALNTVVDIGQRGQAWESVVFTGGMACIRGVAPTLIASLHRYAADIPQVTESGQIQYTRRARHAKTPEYFSEFRERPDMTSFLGGCIYAKLGFLEVQGGEWMTKQAYNEQGPSIARVLSVA